MMRVSPWLALAVMLPVIAFPARAQQAEAKEAARSASCTPGKLEVLKAVTGRLPETIYKITCTVPKDMVLVVQCRDRTCTILR